MNKFIRLHDIGYPSLCIYDHENDRLIDIDKPRFVVRETPIEVMVNPNLIEEVRTDEYMCKKLVYEKVRLDRFGFFYKTSMRVVPFLNVSPTFVKLVSGRVYYVSESISELEKMLEETTR